MICIMCALQSEYENIQSYYHINQKRKINENSFLSVCEENIIIIKSQVGPGGAKECADFVVNNYHKISLIISAGMAGAICPELKLGDIVLSDYVIKIKGRQLETEKSKSNMKVIHNFLKTYDNTLQINKCGINLSSGKILTVDRMLRNKTESDLYYKKYHAACVEMESYPILHICNERKIAFVSVKTISDYADQKSMINILRIQDKILFNLGKFLADMISYLRMDLHYC